MNSIRFNSENDTGSGLFLPRVTANFGSNGKEELFVSFESMVAACVAGDWRLIASSWQLST